MKVTDIQTFLMHANVPDSAGWRAQSALYQGPYRRRLGLDIVDEAIAHYPSDGNSSPPQLDEYTYVRARLQRATWLHRGDPWTRPSRTSDFV